MLRVLIFVLSLFFSISYADEGVAPLPPDQAFHLQTTLSDETHLTLQWKIAPGYYLYRDKIKITLLPDSQVKLGYVVLPQGVDKKDNIRGAFQIYSGILTIAVPLEAVHKGKLDIGIGYQGCSSNGFCYAPESRSLNVDLKNLKAPENVTHDLVVLKPQMLVLGEEESIKQIFYGKSDVIVILSFLGLGILLAFTPCVLPMVPILSSIIVGHRHKHIPMRTFFLSFSYVMGMAMSYAIAGIIVALIGKRIQTILQDPWVIVLASLILILLALSLFGLYQLRLPQGLQKYLTAVSHRQRSGYYVDVFIMGGLSSLIVSPCVSPPLVGILAYIAETGNMWFGGIALFALGIGMGIPLLLFGLSAGKFLPKAGPWMIVIEKTMGVVLLGLSVWLLGRVIPGPLTLFLWSALCIIVAIFMGLFRKRETKSDLLRQGVALILLVYGIILMIGAALGNRNPLEPWGNLKVTSEKISLNVITVKSMMQLDEALNQAKVQNKPTLIDFYADWCVSCVLMEEHVFQKPDVRNALSSFVYLRVDVTNNNDFDQAVMKRFNIVAPPTFLFFASNGQELLNERIVGEMSKKHFLEHINKIGSARIR